MRLSNRLSLPLALAVLLSATLASAQYVGPSTTPAYRSVGDVLKNPVDDAPVVLVGYLVRQVGKEKYTFSDRTSEIRVDIDSKLFPAVAINDTTRVQIRGEVEKDFMESPEIDVDSIAIVN